MNPFRKKVILVSALSTGGFFFVSYALLIFFSRTVLYVDGKAHIEYSLNKRTVRDLLDSFRVQVGPEDIVKPPLDEKIRWGERVRVVRVRSLRERASETVDFVLESKRRTGKNLRMVELQSGHRKMDVWEINRVFHDGREVESAKTLTRSSKTPVRRLVLLNERGYTEKVYDLSKVKKMTLVATCYWEGDPQVPGVITYLGYRMKRGMVAVDPTVIPLRSRLFIPGYGYAYACDTGSAIKGNRIDFVVSNAKASLEWEYKKVTVYVLDKAKSW